MTGDAFSRTFDAITPLWGIVINRGNRIDRIRYHIMRHCLESLRRRLGEVEQ